MGKKKKKETKGKTLVRAVTIVIGLAFAIPMMAGALASVFNQRHSNGNYPEAEGDYPTAEEQLQLQAEGYEKVLAREPNNSTALQGLAQIYLQTGNTEKAIPVLEKIVEYYPEQKEVAAILQVIKQEEASQPAATEDKPEETPETAE